jgi:hypothetical protein
MSTVEFEGGPLDGTVVTAAFDPWPRFVVVGGVYLLGDRRDTAPGVWPLEWRPDT